jgi:hypothetical protein
MVQNGQEWLRIIVHILRMVDNGQQWQLMGMVNDGLEWCWLLNNNGQEWWNMVQ